MGLQNAFKSAANHVRSKASSIATKGVNRVRSNTQKAIVIALFGTTALTGHNPLISVNRSSKVPELKSGYDAGCHQKIRDYIMNRQKSIPRYKSDDISDFGSEQAMNEIIFTINRRAKKHDKKIETDQQIEQILELLVVQGWELGQVELGGMFVNNYVSDIDVEKKLDQAFGLDKSTPPPAENQQ